MIDQPQGAFFRCCLMCDADSRLVELPKGKRKKERNADTNFEECGCRGQYA
jgi:hypothetical protein